VIGARNIRCMSLDLEKSSCDLEPKNQSKPMNDYDLFEWLQAPKPKPSESTKNVIVPTQRSDKPQPDVQASKAQQVSSLPNPASSNSSVGKPQHAAITRAEKLRELADGMNNAVKEKLNPSIGNQRSTPRRARIAAGIREEGRKLKLVQDWLYKLADAWESNTVPKVLQGISTKKTLEYFSEMLCSKWNPSLQDYDQSRIASIWDISSNYYEPWRRSLASAGIYNAQTTLDACSHLNCLEETIVSSKQFEIENLMRETIGANIASYFPTPENIGKRMLELAELHSNCRVLETSAGSGHLADLIIKSYPGIQVDCCEINPDLRKILKLKGHRIYAEDFLAEVDPSSSSWDAIIQNPPFEKMQDIDFVRHAYDCLKDDGTLVSIMSPMWTYRSEPKASEFRDWVKAVNGFWEDLPDGSFYASDIPTGVRAGILVIIK
jgi:predicted RNA methylase